VGQTDITNFFHQQIKQHPPSKISRKIKHENIQKPEKKQKILTFFNI
jgi:hypothetical protein